MELSPSCQREASDMYKFYTRSRYLELKKKKKNHKNLFSNFYTLNLFLLSRVKLFVKVKTHLSNGAKIVPKVFHRTMYE